MRDYVNRQVEKLIKKHKTNNPFKLIDVLGINLICKSDLGELKGFYYVAHRERYIVINSSLHEREQLLVAAHELGHHCLHRHLAKISPLKDFMIYDMSSHTEYEANLFASELLIEDNQVVDCIAEEMDFFYMCSSLGFRPEFVTFKLYNMLNKGHNINLPQNIDSRFLGR
ncbi:MAG: ImmA/IrrE family metallo-endopeptidase [Anaerotignaceae bacterium]